MAALLLSSPMSSNTYRMSQVGLCFHSDMLQKSIVPLSIHLQCQRYKIKTYMLSYEAGSRCHFFRLLLGRAGSLEIDDTHQGTERLDKFLDQSNNPLDHLNDLEIRLQELFHEVKNLMRIGKKNDAVDLLQANYEALKEQMEAGFEGIEEAATLDIIALGYLAIGDLKIVGSMLSGLDKVVDGLNDDEPFLDSILVHMGSMYASLGNFKKSISTYKRVLRILEKEYGNKSTFLVTPLLGIAKALGSISKANKAIDMYNQAVAILESNRGLESEELVIPLHALGNLLIKEGRAMDAENHFNRILKIYVKMYGENDGKVGMAMCSLAHVKCAKGNVGEAIQLYRNALCILKNSKAVALDDTIMEKMRVDLAELLHVVGREEEGRVLLQECLLITKNYKGKEHPSSVTHLINLATSYSRSKNFVEAERLLRTSLQIMEKTVAPDDPALTFPMLHLAVTLYNSNQSKEAEQLALDVLRIREKAFGKESPPVGEALDCLVCIQSRLQRDDSELLRLLKRVLSIQEKTFGRNSEEVMETLKKIIFYLNKMGMRVEKLSLEKRLSMLRKEYKQRIHY